MPDLVVVFRTSSGIEAGIVRSLLEAHGIMSVVSSDVPQSIFPLSVDGLGNIRLAVHPSESVATTSRRFVDRLVRKKSAGRCPR